MDSETTRAFLILSGALGAFGLLFLMLGGWQFRGARTFARTATKSSGVVVGFRTRRVRRARRDSSSPDLLSDFPVVRYVTAAGQTIEFESAFGTRPPIHREGEVVVVLYDPAVPQQARIASRGWLYGIALIFIALGTVLLAFAAIFGLLLWFMGA